MKNKIIKFIGFSGSGKTTLIEKIVRKLTDEGISVATVKHDVHGLQMDKEGKDSFRYSLAGSKISVVSSKDMTVYKIHKTLSLDEIISNIKDVDLIIVEGYSTDNNYYCISVARKNTQKGFKNGFIGVDAVVSDYSEIDIRNMGFNGKIFDINNVDKIKEYIKNQFL